MRGLGLGLALVQRLAHAGGGEAALRAAATGGLDVVIRLPSARPPGEGASGPGGDRPRRPRREAPALPA